MDDSDRMDAEMKVSSRLHGPAGGNPNDVKPVRTIAAGTDPVALDAWAMRLFPDQPAPPSLGFAAAMGLGRVDYAALSPVEIVVG